MLGRYLPTGLPDGTLDSDAVEGAMEPPYGFPAILVDWVRADPPIPVSWWRGVGPTHNVFVVESFVDELAAAAKQDPVAFRRAMLDKNPRALAGLSPTEVRGMTNIVASLPSRGITVIWVEHVLYAIMKAAPRIMVLHRGRLIADGAPERLAKDPAVIKAYFGEELSLA